MIKFSQINYKSYLYIFVHIFIILFLCALFGAILNYFHLPASWVLGATIVSLFLSIKKVNVSPNKYLRAFASTIIGLSLANGIHTQLKDTTGLNFFSEKWISGLSLMFIMVVIVLILNYRTYRKNGYDANTSILSVLPGGLSSTLLLADSFPSDKHVITITQVVRYIFTIFLFSLFFVFESIEHHNNNNADLVFHPLFPQVSFILIMFFTIIFIRRFFNITPLIFALVVGVFLYQMNIVNINLDSFIRILAQVLLGWLAGCQLNLLDRKKTKHLIILALKSSIIASIISIILSFIGYKFFNLNLKSLLLALAPGGADSMTFLSLNLNLDILFVSFNQLIRIVSLDMIVMLFTTISNKKQKKTKSKNISF